LKIGQNLSIPGQTIVDSPYSQSIASNNSTNVNSYYTVKSGDSFWTIARKNNTSVKKLLQWNSMSANAKLKPGQKLLLANKVASSVDNKITYQIQSGDTLHKIASKFSVSKNDLINWNKVKNESYIHPGQELVIFTTAKN
jgi:membrane-bound lytic murein transglycosylase D